MDNYFCGEAQDLQMQLSGGPSSAAWLAAVLKTLWK